MLFKFSHGAIPIPHLPSEVHRRNSSSQNGAASRHERCAPVRTNSRKEGHGLPCIFDKRIPALIIAWLFSNSCYNNALHLHATWIQISLARLTRFNRLIRIRRPWITALVWRADTTPCDRLERSVGLDPGPVGALVSITRQVRSRPGGSIDPQQCIVEEGFKLRQPTGRIIASLNPVIIPIQIGEGNDFELTNFGVGDR